MEAGQWSSGTADEPTDPDVDLDHTAQRREMRDFPHATIAVVALGGALGAVARYGAGLVWPTGTQAFPWTTLTVNAVGCLVIGVFMVVLGDVWLTAHRLVRPFFGTGVLGGFTTFSTYCVDIQRLTAHGRPAPALGYLLATVLLSLVAVTTGAWSTRRLLNPRSVR